MIVIITRIAYGAAIAILSLLLASCGVSKERLDEVVFYDGPQFKLKLVRYYENYPLHFNGEVFRVQCASAHTANPGNEMQDPGWRVLGSGAAIGSKSAAEVAERERVNYHVLGDEILVWTGNGVNVSFDGCGRFAHWYPTDLPAEWIVPADKPDYCAPKGKVDCRNHDFLSDRAPNFEEIRANAQGAVSFVVRSKAFRDERTVGVQSTDFGRSWAITVIE